jgi:hypothetical protein
MSRMGVGSHCYFLACKSVLFRGVRRVGQKGMHTEIEPTELALDLYNATDVTMFPFHCLHTNKLNSSKLYSGYKQHIHFSKIYISNYV